MSTLLHMWTFLNATALYSAAAVRDGQKAGGRGGAAEDDNNGEEDEEEGEMKCWLRFFFAFFFG